MININDLTKRKREREKKRMENYNNILKICHNKILSVSNNITDQEYIFFTIPNIIFGQPLINIEECSIYLIQKLIQNGFMVKYLGKGFIFISWKHISQKNNKKSKLLLPSPPKKKVTFKEKMISPLKNNSSKGYRSIKDIPSTDNFLNHKF